MKKILSYFLQGLLYVVPIGVTILLLFKAVAYADSLFAVFGIPGAGLVIIFVFVTIVGYLGRMILTPSVVRMFNRMMSSAPLIKMIYTSVRDLLNAFVGKKKKFDRPVIVSLDNEGINHRLGFVTQDDLGTLGLPGMVSVYAPYSYSFMGDLIIVPRDHVRPLDTSATDVMKMVVSGGVSSAEDKEQDI